MPSNLGRYLADLATDPQKVADLRADPAAEMNKANLNSEEKEALKRADPVEIRKLLMQEHPGFAASVVIVVTIV